MKQEFKTKKDGKKITIYVNFYAEDRADVTIEEKTFFTCDTKQILGAHDWQVDKLLRSYDLLPREEYVEPPEILQQFTRLPLYLTSKLA